MKKVFKHLFLIGLISIGAVACGSEDKENPSTKPDKVVEETPKNTVPTPDFSDDSAFAYIQKQVDFGPRVPNTEAHKACGNWMVEELEKNNFEVILQEDIVTAWNGDELQMKNIMGQFNKEAEQRIMLCAHWDTRPFADKDTKNKYKPIDGANDGGSGVGVLLEIARQINLKSPGYGVDIVFFDAEDYGTFQGPEFQDLQTIANDWCLGSQYWSKNPPIKNYHPKYGILLDMVGAPGATFPKEGVSIKYATKHVNALWKNANQNGYGKFFVNFLSYEITDDHSYINAIAGIPTLDIIDMRPNGNGQYYGFGPSHHTHGDNMDVIDKNTLKAVGQTVLEAIYQQL